MRHAILLLTTSGCAVLPSSLDLSDLSMPEALAASLDHLESRYAFTEHKQLDWDAVPALDDVRQLVPLLPDAHVQLHNEDRDVELCPEARGSFGIVLSDLDDGRVVVTAGAGGLQPGDEVLRFDGVPIAEARAVVAFACYPRGAATLARVRQIELVLLGRGEVGDTATVTVLREANQLEAVLQADVDTSDIDTVFGIGAPTVRVAGERLAEGPGYIRVGWEATYQTETAFQKELARLQDAPSLVIDLRGNDGGMERTAANVAGFFARDRAFYETVTFLNNRTGEQEVMSEVWTEPQEIWWGRPVAVLIDATTVSSGEGLAMLLSRQPQVQIVGFEGTAASFGSTGSSIVLPQGWTLDFPGGRSLDVDGRIQLDSDATMDGGVHPTIRVPWTVDHRVALAAGADPVLDAAIAWLAEATR